MKKIIFPSMLVLAFVAISCGNKANTFEELAKASWIIGKWGATSAQGTMVETWQQKNDSTFVGKSHFVVGSDTVFTETITLEQHGKEVNYITQMANQNEGKPVAFKMTFANEKKLVFENAAHDFPQKITYENKGDSLIAEISGKQNGKKASERFPMARIK